MPDDSFVLPGSVKTKLLMQLSRFAAPAGAGYWLTSLTLDTLPELADYRQCVSGSGTSMTRIRWRESSGCVLERFLLDEESLECERESEWFENLENLCSAVHGEGGGVVSKHVV